MLPPYPRLVTELTTVKVNHPDNRSKEAYVRALLQLPVVDPRYAKDKYGTKCNFLGHDVMHVMGYPVDWMVANQYLKWMRLGGSPFSRMVIQDAIHNANLGCPTFGMLYEEPHGHMTVVLPQSETTDPAEVLIAQAGAVNFYGRQMRYGVPRAQCAAVEWYGAP